MATRKTPPSLGVNELDTIDSRVDIQDEFKYLRIKLEKEDG